MGDVCKHSPEHRDESGLCVVCVSFERDRFRAIQRTLDVLEEVAKERTRQDEKWGEQNHPDGTGGELHRTNISPDETNRLRDIRRTHAEDAKKFCDSVFSVGAGTWRHILREEVDEAIAEDDPAALRKELIQVAAVAVSWVECIDRRARGDRNV